MCIRDRYKKETYDDVAKAAMDAKAKKKPKPVKLSDAAKAAKAEKLEKEQQLRAMTDAGVSARRIT